jgi:arginyl-tRNA synthetase
MVNQLELNIFLIIKQDIFNALTKNNTIEGLDIDTFDVSYPNQVKNDKAESGNRGDFTTNIAMIYASKLKQKPADLANSIVACLKKSISYMENIHIAGPGFINIFVNKSFVTDIFFNVARSYTENDLYGIKNYGFGTKVNVEFASPNPTGPVHIGHIRGSVYGDVISRLLSLSGYDVTREFYINDAGEQINKVVESTFVRYYELIGKNHDTLTIHYPGEYLKDLAENLKSDLGNNLDYVKDFDAVKQYSMNSLLGSIKKSFVNFGISHDVYTSEQKIISDNFVERAVKLLESKDLLYKGYLEKPKGKSNPDWEANEQLLFKSRLFGDDEDRVIKKSDGSNTYFTGDVGYHLNKIERGFKKLILVLGADHLGYVKRITSVTKALDSSVEINVKLCQLVKFVKGGESVKMSKRKGTFETIDDILEEVDKNIVRFIMVSRNNNMEIDFDFDKVKQMSKDNELFYIQYAYSRANSVLNSYKSFDIKHIQESMIDKDYEIDLIKTCLEYPRVVRLSIQNLEPHHICFYLYHLASLFHRVWHYGNEDQSCRFISDDQTKTNTKLTMAFCVKNIISSGFKILGIEAIERM